MKLNFRFAMLLLACFALLSGCAKMPEPGDAVVEKSQPKIAHDAGKALVYFFRPGHLYFGLGATYFVKEDGREIGVLDYNTFFIHKTTPGKHTYSISTESTVTTDIFVKAGQTYYVKCGYRVGFLVGRPSMRLGTVSEFTKSKTDLKYIRLTTKNEKEAMNAKKATETNAKKSEKVKTQEKTKTTN